MTQVWKCTGEERSGITGGRKEGRSEREATTCSLIDGLMNPKSVIARDVKV
jgi:hypothetical protein